MKKTKVININHHYNLKNCFWVDQKDYIYIGRPSKWGNPFKIGRDGSRQEVIKKFRDYILNNKILLQEITELDGKELGCWCIEFPLGIDYIRKEKRCHGEILLEILELYKEIFNVWL